MHSVYHENRQVIPLPMRRKVVKFKKKKKDEKGEEGREEGEWKEEERKKSMQRDISFNFNLNSWQFSPAVRMTTLSQFNPSSNKETLFFNAIFIHEQPGRQLKLTIMFILRTLRRFQQENSIIISVRQIGSTLPYLLNFAKITIWSRNGDESIQDWRFL